MSHYDTLGVPRDASADAIKQAYRRRSAQAHPDKGGDAEEMSAINRAYEVLGDAERRAEYDRTGIDAAPGSLEQEARGALMQLFQSALEGAENVLADVSTMLGMHRQRLLQAQADAQAKRARLVKRTGKIRVKKGENLVQMLIDQQIRQIDDALPMLDRGLAVNDLCAQMLRDYEQQEDAPPSQLKPVSIPFLNGFKEGFGGWR